MLHVHSFKRSEIILEVEKKVYNSSPYFKCDNCSQEFTLDSFRIAVFLYGAIFLMGKEYAYFGIVCPNCINTTLRKIKKQQIITVKEELGDSIILVSNKNEIKYEDYRRHCILLPSTEKMILSSTNSICHESYVKYYSFPIEFRNILPLMDEYDRFKKFYKFNIFYSSLRGRTTIKMTQRELMTDMDTVIGPDGIYSGKLSKSNNVNIDNIYLSYIQGSRLCENSMNCGYDEEEIDELLRIENETKIKVFPRYVCIQDVRTSCDRYCGWEFGEILYDKDLTEYRDDRKSYWSPSNFYETHLTFLKTLEVGINSLYPFNFEITEAILKHLLQSRSRGESRDLNEIFPPELKMNSNNQFDKIIEKVWANFGKEYFQNILLKKSFEFVLEYLKLANRIDCSDALIWKLKQRYLNSLYDAIKSPYKRRKISKETTKETREAVQEAEKNFKGVDIISQNDKINRYKIKLPHYVRPSKKKIDILLQGESGTGKELFARACYEASKRTGKYIKINCASIPENQLESELFGYTKGAFTGAHVEKKGAFRAADKGVLFLDEISKLDFKLQPKLLRAIREREIQTLGKDQPDKVDVMIVMATNQDLIQLVNKGEFQGDLFWRVHRRVIDIPPLRERKDDIPLLINHLIEKYSDEQENGKKMSESLKFSEDCVKYLKTLNWPGNVGQLETVVGNIVEDRIQEKSMSEITISDISEYILINTLPKESHQKEQLSKKKQHSDEQIIAALEKHDGNRTHAAKYLDITTRQIRRRIQNIGKKYVPPPAS